MYKLACICVILVTFFFILEEQIYADSFDLRVLAPGAPNVYVELYPFPFHDSDVALLSLQATQATQKNFYQVTFTNILPDEKFSIFIYESLDGSGVYNPHTDPSYFSTNSNQGFTTQTNIIHNPVPVFPRISGIHLTATYQDPNVILLSITVMDNTINFLNYDKSLLSVTLTKEDKKYSIPLAYDTSCSLFYCGSITARMQPAKAGNYDVSVSYGLESLLSLPNALHLIAPSITDTPARGINRDEKQQSLFIPSPATPSITDTSIIHAYSSTAYPRLIHRVTHKEQNFFMILFTTFKHLINAIRKHI